MEIHIDVYGLERLDDTLRRIRELKSKYPEADVTIRVIVGHSG